MLRRLTWVAQNACCAAAVVAILVVLPFGTPTQAQAEPGATQFLTELTTRSVKQLTEPGITSDEQERRFRRLVKEGFDLPSISRFVLGRYWRRANPKERAEFQTTFEDLLVHRFLPMFSLYSGERLHIIAERPFSNNPNFVNIASELRGEDVEPILVDWRVRRLDNRYKIVDVVAEGVSIAVTLRSEYTSVLRKNDGNVTVLIRTLRAMVDRL